MEAALPPTYPWEAAKVGRPLTKRERVATRDDSRALVRLTKDRLLRMNENSNVVILPSLLKADPTSLHLTKGEIFVHNRGENAAVDVTTPTLRAKPKGTQFRIKVAEDGTTTFTVLEGEVTLENDHGSLTLGSLQEGVTKPGAAPVLSSRLDAVTAIQWCLYYPGILHLPELQIPEAESTALAAPIAAYHSGDIPAALRSWPVGYQPRSIGAKGLRAMLLLAVGQVDEARLLLTGDVARSASGRAVMELINAVNLVEQPAAAEPATSGEWLARSYYQQSRGKLPEGLAAAKRAQEIAPDSSYAAVRVAELEFSFGRSNEAEKHLEEGLALGPRNAQGYALMGFLLAARNCIDAARTSFGSAIGIDPALGNAWLGRGLCSIRQGHAEEGYEDLQVAVALEPNRSLLHSYRGKAAFQLGLERAGSEDLAFAKEADKEDPTPWLYSAIELQRQNRTNEAIAALQESIGRNDNRLIYRSEMLLDQDRAMRSANLAKIYQSAGLRDLAVREATFAVEADYTNASAHLFLANSFDALRDPTRISLRYETAWFNELLLANLLSPVGGGSLSQFVSQQEYSKLLEADGFTGSTTTEYRSDGQFLNQSSLSGTFGNFSFGLDFEELRGDGHRPNNDFHRDTVYWQAKYQATPDDMFYAFVQCQRNESGDLLQTYSDQPQSAGFRFEEIQDPGQVIVGWNHRWAPGVHTLVLGAHLSGQQVLTDPLTTQLLLARETTPRLEEFFDGQPAGAVVQNNDGSLTYSDAFLSGIETFTGQGLVNSMAYGTFDFRTLRKFEIYSGEIQQIWETNLNTLIAGGRWQAGDFETSTRLTLLNDPNNEYLFAIPAANQHEIVDFERSTIYLYDFAKINPWLTLVGGVSWDRIEHPENFRSPPVSARTDNTTHWNGKAGFTISPSSRLRVRGVYSEGMGGVTFEDSVRLEPVQLAGFNQSYRTIISESLAGSVEAPLYKNAGLSIDGGLDDQTWWGASLNVLEEDVHRTIGAFDGFESPVFPAGGGYVPGGTKQSLFYQEKVFMANINRIIGDQFAIGASYRHTTAELREQLPQLFSVNPDADRKQEGELQELRLSAVWNSPTGLFARFDARWYAQELDILPGDDFWQSDFALGYRFNQNLCEVSAGVMNITGDNYRLSPLTYTSEIPRDRTLFVRCRLSF